MGDTLKNAADDAAFIAALMKLDDFKKKVYTKANENDNLPDFSTFVTKAELETPDAVKKILGAKDGQKSVLVEKLGDFLDATHAVYGNSNPKKVAKDFLAEKSSLVKTDGSNATSHTDKGKALSEAILGAKDGQKSILVEEFGKAFSDTSKTADYDSKGVKTAKAFLEGEGLGSASADPSAVAAQLLNETNKGKLGTAVLDSKDSAQKKLSALVLDAKDSAQKTLQEQLAGNTDFKATVQGIDSENPTFQREVREVMLQPFCKIPEGENEPMCCYDPHPTCLLGA